MRKTAFILTMSLTLGLALTPATAYAHHGRSHGGPARVGPGIGGSGPARPSVARPFGTHPFVAHPFVHRRFVPFGVIASPVIVYAPPPVVYSAPPVFYTPPPTMGTVAVAPAPPPMPTVIQYPTGRYELRGDGVTTPYVWVWIPNPPSAPPPPPTPPSGLPAPPEETSDPPPARNSQLYRWTDEQGAVYWTDRWDAVPEQYRTQTTRPGLI
jgi:hypothetical protein